MSLIVVGAAVALALVIGMAIGFALARFAAGPTIPERASRAIVGQHELRRALDGDELVLHYQPKIELGTGQVSCLEALLRWQHPERGLLTPEAFVYVAEQHPELIGALTRWVLRRALRDYNAWTEAGHDWTVAVNITAQDLESVNFAATVAAILQEAGVLPDRLALEVSETALASKGAPAGQVMRALATQGIVISIDDFGTGFLSISQLRTMKVSEVKIARTLITALPGEGATVRSLIDLGSSLGCRITAVGVEWQEVSDWLLDAGCDQGQGYLWLRARTWPEVSQVFGPGARQRLR